MCVKKELPNELLRGLPAKDWIFEGLVTTAAFSFTGKEINGYNELSINWNDDEGALPELLNRVDDDKINFSAGVAHIELKTMKLILKDHIAVGNFKIRRDVVDPTNPYHGEIMLKSGIPKRFKKLIENGLALAAGNKITPQTNT